MIKINITDSGKKKVTKEKIETYEHACHFFLNLWGITQDIHLDLYLDYPIDAFFNPDSPFYQHHELSESAGATHHEGKNYKVFINRTFLKENTENDQDFMDQLTRALAHEIVHVKQYYFNELVNKEDKSYFKGKNTTHISYEKKPHEIEANTYDTQMQLHYYIEKFDMYNFFTDS